MKMYMELFGMCLSGAFVVVVSGWAVYAKVSSWFGKQVLIRYS